MRAARSCSILISALIWSARMAAVRSYALSAASRRAASISLSVFANDESSKMASPDAAARAVRAALFVDDSTVIHASAIFQTLSSRDATCVLYSSLLRRTDAWMVCAVSRRSRASSTPRPRSCADSRRLCASFTAACRSRSVASMVAIFASSMAFSAPAVAMATSYCVLPALAVSTPSRFASSARLLTMSRVCTIAGVAFDSCSRQTLRALSLSAVALA